MTEPAICVLLTTYQRTDCALKTIQGIKQNFHYPQLWWWICDDGSPKGHVSALVDEIGPTYNVRVFDANRRGVGYGMNNSLRSIFDVSDLVLVMEDDWYLSLPLDVSPYVNTLVNHPETGMIRFGYLSPNILGYTVSMENKLFWRIDSNGETYRFTGHPSLRHRRFHTVYGYYDEGLAPGMTELSMCGKVNQRPDGPHILYPCEAGAWGFFGHIGATSLADISPSY